MSTFPIPIEPHYDPANPASSEATMAWVRAHEIGPSILLDGTVSANGASNEGSWVDVLAADVPPEWYQKYPGETNPQKWVPANPADPRNLIYKYAGVYSRGGWDLWVLGSEAKAALDLARSTLVQPPAPVVAPPVQPTVPPVFQVLNEIEFGAREQGFTGAQFSWLTGELGRLRSAL